MRVVGGEGMPACEHAVVPAGVSGVVSEVVTGVPIVAVTVMSRGADCRSAVLDATTGALVVAVGVVLAVAVVSTLIGALTRKSVAIDVAIAAAIAIVQGLWWSRSS